MGIVWVIDQPSNLKGQGGGSFSLPHSALHTEALASLKGLKWAHRHLFTSY